MTPAEFIDNPDWAKFLPETDKPARPRHLPTHEDCSRLDVESAVLHLRAGGTLGRMPGYEERPGQLDMLSSIVRAYNRGGHLMVEAGTGVGKSLAYLIPSILWSAVNDTPVVISTATRNLQSQLMSSDIPKALEVLGDGARAFKVALLKGRANYLCLRAVGDFFSSGYWTMSKDEQDGMPGFIRWLETTEDGDLDRYDGQLPRELLSCPGEECGGRRCPFYSRCFVYRARKKAAEANLVVANHALVLAEATSAGGGILPAYGRLVLDEAHNLESIATEYLSSEFSMPQLNRLLNRLVRRGKGRRGGSGGILSAVERQLSKGILSNSSVGEHVRRLLNDAQGLQVRIVDAADEMLELAEHQVLGGHKDETIRYRGAIDTGAAQGRFEDAVAAMVTFLHDLRDTLDDSVPEGELNFCADLAVQVGGLAEGFVAFANEADFVLRGEQETHAYWAERVRLPNRRAFVRLVAAPLSVADDLRRFLYDLKDSVILSSATLRVGSDFKYMSKRLGFSDAGEKGERYESFVATSPFDYFRQSLVLAPDCLPDPAVDPAGYAEAMAPLMTDLFGATAGRALVLFTSYEMMNAVAERARGLLAAAGIGLLVQGGGSSREAMTAALRSASDRTVLFGSQSFWEGVDVAGEALSCVVIARLPFAQVKDPIVEARSERIEREGGKSFPDYMLPEAAIRFRQGFGRLIRTQRDRGVVVVTDPRIVTKNYGGIFRKSIPATVHTVTSPGELLQRVADFFA